MPNKSQVWMYPKDSDIKLSALETNSRFLKPERLKYVFLVIFRKKYMKIEISGPRRIRHVSSWPKTSSNESEGKYGTSK